MKSTICIANKIDFIDFSDKRTAAVRARENKSKINTRTKELNVNVNAKMDGDLNHFGFHQKTEMHELILRVVT